jgi:prevent-host-death family protein
VATQIRPLAVPLQHRGANRSVKILWIAPRRYVLTVTLSYERRNFPLARNKQTIRAIPISKAKVSLKSLVKRVHRDQEYLVLKDNGTPLAAVMDIDEFEDYLEVNDPKVRKAIELSNEDFRAGRFRPAEELLNELRREQRNRAKSSKTRKR